ncbi:MAG TPA: hypothetical protein VNK41_07930 [Vicinamibacterales bacterium]|nr:hypothetical protein [Vicinamibacterales bacterium]
MAPRRFVVAATALACVVAAGASRFAQGLGSPVSTIVFRTIGVD